MRRAGERERRRLSTITPFRSGIGLPRTRALCALGLFALMACQPRVDIEQSLGTGSGAAREALKRLAAEGPVPVVIRGGFPGLTAAERNRLLVDALAAGVRGLDVAFAPIKAEDAPAERVVVALDPSPAVPPESLCTRTVSRVGDVSANRQRVAAAFCDGPDALSAISGVVASGAPKERERLLWRTADALFPDDYQESYGFDVLPDWLDVGVGGSVGF